MSRGAKREARREKARQAAARQRVAVTALVVVLFALGGTGLLVRSYRLGKAMEACEAKGRAYYRAIGSYPYFSTGELASAEVRARCANTDMAFDGLESVR